DYIYLIGDIGSGLMSIDMALELVDDLELKDKCHVINGPLVEGAFVIGVQTMIDPKPEAVNAQIDSVIESFKE
ncbi:MAG TPA: dihydroxyacetone kinase, partial [Erysipelothrix sp.]|nr:dihydroxyacetone kinase [Erysipelothrix sp.]